MTDNYEYDRMGERETVVNLQRRWTEFMRYTNAKTKTIDSTFLREYANFISNVALRYGAITALANCPEIPNEVLGGIVRDYERELVTWSGHLAGIERREADFRKRLAEVRNAENEVREMVSSAPTMATSTGTLGYAAVQECFVPDADAVTSCDIGTTAISTVGAPAPEPKAETKAKRKVHTP